MTGRAIARVPLTAQVADALVDLILDENLRDGDRLPATDDLAARYGVSRTVVREAIAELAARGIVRRQQGRETVVTTPGHDALTGILRFHVALTGLGATAVHEYRHAVEAAAAGLAASRRTDAHLAALAAQLDVIATTADDTDLHAADVRFHQLVADASGNPLLRMALDAVAPLLHEQRAAAWSAWSAHDRAAVVASHRAILDAIRRRDPRRATDAMRRHLDDAQAQVR